MGSRYLFSLAGGLITAFLLKVLGAETTWALGWGAVIMLTLAVATRYLELRAAQTPGGGGISHAWATSPFSRQSKGDRLQRRINQIDDRLRAYLRAEASRQGFTEYGATATLFDALVGSLLNANWYVAPGGDATPKTLLLGSSGPITRVTTREPDKGDAQEARDKFMQVIGSAKELPDYHERVKLVAELERLESAK